MLAWIKSLGGALIVGAVGVLAFMAAANASKHRKLEREWKDRAIANVESGVAENVEAAMQDRKRARVHGKKAREAETKTKERISANNAREPTMADITSKWRKPKPG